MEKLTILRQALGKARINGREWAGKEDDEGKGEGDLGEYEDYESPDEEIVDPIPRSHMREKWDVETIQSTKTNLENHPRTISARRACSAAAPPPPSAPEASPVEAQSTGTCSATAWHPA